MCGIAGFLDRSGTPREALEARVDGMASTLRHRGPHAGGVWSDQDAGVALAHRRLAVIDVTAAGNQPMVSASGRYVVTYNGEIYNHAELRARLPADPATFSGFRGGSDTAALLAAVEHWGLEAALDRFNGMFAFALWDRKTRTLDLVRDRVGEKPLYYGWSGGTFVFASELKAIQAHPDVRLSVDRQALAQFFRHSYVPSPWSIYQGIFKLPPGTRLTVRRDPTSDGCSPRAYWAPERIADAAAADHWPEHDAVERFEALLTDAVRLRMAADVPVGAFLSGGIDSSLVVALMVQASRHVKTFTIGFGQVGYDEAPWAGAVARHLGTDHTEVYVTAADALAVVPRLPLIYDEPFADSSQIPTTILSTLARSAVTVALSGEGADELFGGYERYRWGDRVWRVTRALPTPARALAARAMECAPSRILEAVGPAASRLLPPSWRVRHPGNKVRKLVAALTAARPDEWYLALVSQADDNLVVGASAEPLIPAQPGIAPHASLLEREMFWDVVTYLPGDLLVKLDRAAMSVSLESRLPFLDHRIVECAWRLPLRMKVRGRKGKWIVRQVLQRYVPPALVDRPKTGFAVPLHEWLRGPLRPWADALLDPQRLRAEGFLDVDAVMRRWREHCAGTFNWSALLWNVLMFEAWREQTSAPVSTRREGESR